MTRSRRKALSHFLLYAAATVALLVAVFPYAYLLIQSLAPWDQVERRWIPSDLTLRSYLWLLEGGEASLPRPWLRAFLNSVIVSLADTATSLLCGMMAGYALSRLRFRGARAVYNFLLFHMFYPGIMLLVPTFLIVRSLGLYNTYLAMILPKAVHLWVIFMYTNFFMRVPQELLDAARADGAGEWTILWRIAAPLTGGLTTILGLFVFTERWAELLWDLLAVRDEGLMTLNVLLASMQGPYGTYPGPLYAAAALLTLPIVLVFLIFSRRFLVGVSYIFR
ncbi:MAG: sugar ABC transporter permease [Bacillota bacterium]|nr:MAG: sugar ABC transporter permease [Bacillota bacterium]